MIVLFMFVVECTDLTRYFAMKCNCTSMLRPLFATKRLTVSRISCTNISCNVQYGEYPISKYLIWAVPIMVMGSTSITSSTKRTKISLVHLILNIEKFYTSTYITLLGGSFQGCIGVPLSCEKTERKNVTATELIDGMLCAIPWALHNIRAFACDWPLCRLLAGADVVDPAE